ncbi:translation initiation factor IF-2 subunit alpha [Nanoarchaeota archaeon]
MLYRRQGFPEEGELVTCTVADVQKHSVFVKLDEYGKQGLIHIAEVSPGRIRNIRDFVSEGKVIVCKVLRVNLDRGHIDLSLRRVSEGMRRSKIESLKQELKAEKIIEFASKQLKKPLEPLYEDIFSKVSKEYEMLYLFFEDVVSGNADLKILELDKKTEEVLSELIKQRIKPLEIVLKGKLKAWCYSADGLSVIKDALSVAENQEKAQIIYDGGGTYTLTVVAEDPKIAKNLLTEVSSEIIKRLKENEGNGEFIQLEN